MTSSARRANDMSFAVGPPKGRRWSLLHDRLGAIHPGGGGAGKGPAVGGGCNTPEIRKIAQTDEPRDSWHLYVESDAGGRGRHHRSPHPRRGHRVHDPHLRRLRSLRGLLAEELISPVSSGRSRLAKTCS